MPVKSSKLHIAPVKGDKTSIEASLIIEFESFAERDLFSRSLLADPNYNQYWSDVLNSRNSPISFLILSVHKERGVVFIPEANINKILTYLNAQNKNDTFDFLANTKNKDAKYICDPIFNNSLKGILFSIPIFPLIAAKVFSSSFVGFQVFLGTIMALLLHYERFLSKMEALNKYKEKADRNLIFSAKEIKGFEIGVGAAKTWTAYFQSFTQRDAYSSAYQAGFAAQENDNNPELIGKILQPKLKRS